MAKLLLLPEGWPRLLALLVGLGILALIWVRRSWLEGLEPAGEAASEPGGMTGPDSSWPQRSLVIVARNEQTHLPGLLQDLDHLLDRDAGLELILADDQSDDGSRRMLEDFVRTRQAEDGATGGGGPRAFLLTGDPARRGKAAWLRHALSQCRGRQVLFSDADCRLPAGWSLALGRLLDEGLVAAGGLVLLQDRPNPDAAAGWQRLHWLLLSGMGAALSGRAGRIPSAPSLWGGNLAFDRAAVERLGGYPSLALAACNEDLALARALAGRGAPLRLVAHPRDSRVRTAPCDWLGVARQLGRWGRGTFRLAPRDAMLVMGALAWLACLAGILLLRPLLGLLLAATASLSLAALLGELAARLDEEPVTLSQAARYLATWPFLLLPALWFGLRGHPAWRRPS